ncbi:MAG: IPT/TIG domain-containing protein, partial [Bryobacterales bacterium]|nr:IPT/TIG domain-containing protein [Bryobacterales bacterium]
ASFSSFLTALKYTDGTPVNTVDVVAHSEGGLVLRTYLSGKQNAAGVFQPPANTHIRKAVFLASPHFGTPVASLLGIVPQVNELASGSGFLFALDTWNQGTDDLRGIDAVAAVGNAGSGGTGNPAGFDDGVVPLTSGSLRFYLPGRTRVIPYCHIDGGGIITLFNLCPSNAPGIADIESPAHNSAQIIVSFLNGTDAWQSVGTAAEANPFLSVDGGLIVALHNADDTSLNIVSATATPGQGKAQSLSVSSSGLAYSDLVPAGTVALNSVYASLNVNSSVTLPAGGTEPFTLKPGPLIVRAFPAAASIFPLSLAPRMLISIYGTDLADQTAEPTGGTFPTQLADAQVLVGGTAIQLYYVSATQINAVLPSVASGLMQLTIQNSAGKNTVNVYVGAASPAIFTQDSSGTGPAAALKASDQSLVTAGNPLHSGDTVELYVTGLGATTSNNGLDYANQQPTVTIAGVACPVTFAGAAPGYIGLDQINCSIPSGLAATNSGAVVITSGTMVSNTATLAVD